MLSVHAVNPNTLEVKILPPHFHDDLARLKNTIPASDREFLEVKQVWLIRNARNYSYVDWVYRALDVLRPARPGEIKLTQGALW